jgi:single-stranded DNA-binding protein
MNQVFVCAQAAEDPKEIYLDSSRTALKVKVQLPPISTNKAPTELYYHIYQDQGRWRSLIKQGTCLFIHGAKLHHDLEAREHSLHGGNPAVVDDSFPIYNSVILTGRIAKDPDVSNPMTFKTTESGLMIANMSLTVSKGKMTADLFNFTAMNKVTDSFKPAELLVNLCKKGTGITVQGQLITDSWFDHGSKQQRYNTKIQVKQMTLAPKTEMTSNTIKPTTTIATESVPKSLWGGRTADSELPDSPHQAAIATPQNQTPETEQAEPKPPMAIAEPWGANTNGLPPLPNNESAQPF